MSRVFDPVVSTFFLSEAKNHNDSTEFKLSYGYENNCQDPIFKVQIIDGGKIKGRQAPSYSDHDFDEIIYLRKQLKAEFEKTDHRLRDIGFEVENHSTSKSRFAK
ncbi:hypothetical protein [Lactiplantibacillus plantarum]|uniref:hypothetical protein n=1 Tax=Lactiplantibacillus plantarum TaxID=1590 RepID=UPI002072FA11|nr:hypothetical protein [Lactiplantibacillus plantarum]